MFLHLLPTPLWPLSAGNFLHGLPLVCHNLLLLCYEAMRMDRTGVFFAKKERALRKEVRSMKYCTNEKAQIENGASCSWSVALRGA